MDLTPHVDGLRHELAAAVGAADPDADAPTRALADRFAAVLEPAVRLTLLDVLSAAAAEITRDLAPGSVDLRLRGRDPGFVVTPPFPPAGIGPRSAPVAEPDDATTARINLRLPDHLKARIERAAGRDGSSVNAWLVRAATAAVQLDQPPDRRPDISRDGERYRGWVR